MTENWAGAAHEASYWNTYASPGKRGTPTKLWMMAINLMAMLSFLMATDRMAMAMATDQMAIVAFAMETISMATNSLLFWTSAQAVGTYMDCFLIEIHKLWAPVYSQYFSWRFWLCRWILQDRFYHISEVFRVRLISKQTKSSKNCYVGRSHKSATVTSFQWGALC